MSTHTYTHFQIMAGCEKKINSSSSMYNYYRNAETPDKAKNVN